MSIDAILVDLIRPVIWFEARLGIRAKLGARASRCVCVAAMARYCESSRSIPRETTIGARVMVRLAALAIAFFRSLAGHGLSNSEALELTSQITWRIYRRLAWLPWVTTRLRHRDPLRRVKIAMDLFMRFPYSQPGYHMDYVKCDKQTVGFDVSRCPVAEYFRREGLSNLCGPLFCDLDFPLADQWGLELCRPLTLSNGADYCDFRYHPKSSAPLGKAVRSAGEE